MQSQRKHFTFEMLSDEIWSERTFGPDFVRKLDFKGGDTLVARLEVLRMTHVVFYDDYE